MPIIPRKAHNVTSKPIFAILLISLLMALPAVAEAANEEPPAKERPWFIYLQLVNAYPRMESEKLVGRLFDPAMRALAPSYEDVDTVRSLRDENKLWVPQFGAGKVLSDHWVAYFQWGWTAGKVRTKADDPSIFLLPLHTDFEIKRGALSISGGANYYPFGTVKLNEFEGFSERLRASRPFIGADVTFTHATFRAKVKVGFSPFPNIVNLELSDAWNLPSINTHVGLEYPLNDRNSLGITAGYSFFFDRAYDFEGVAVTLAWNHYFR